MRKRRLQSGTGSTGFSIQDTLRMGPFFPPDFEAVVLPIGAAPTPTATLVAANRDEAAAAKDEAGFWWWWILLIALLLLLLLLLLLCLFCCCWRKKREEDEVTEAETVPAKTALVAQATMDAYEDEENEEAKARRATVAKQAEQQQSMMDGESEEGEGEGDVLIVAPGRRSVTAAVFAAAAIDKDDDGGAAFIRGAAGNQKRIRSSLDEGSTGTPIQGLALYDHWGNRRGPNRAGRRDTTEDYLTRGVEDFFEQDMENLDYVPDSEGVASRNASKRVNEFVIQ